MLETVSLLLALAVSVIVGDWVVLLWLLRKKENRTKTQPDFWDPDL